MWPAARFLPSCCFRLKRLADRFARVRGIWQMVKRSCDICPEDLGVGMSERT